MDFFGATFNAVATFDFATFSAKADLSDATFNANASFSAASFNAAANFDESTFSAKADLSDATFKDYVKFAGSMTRKVFSSTSSLDLQFARIEKPDRVSFHTLSLRPHWFVNVDARKFDFTNVNWDRRSVNEEIKSLANNRVSSPHPLLAIACRNLAVNAEENHRYEDASAFRYMAMDARRRENGVASRAGD